MKRAICLAMAFVLCALLTGCGGSGPSFTKAKWGMTLAQVEAAEPTMEKPDTTLVNMVFLRDEQRAYCGANGLLGIQVKHYRDGSKDEVGAIVWRAGFCAAGYAVPEDMPWVVASEDPGAQTKALYEKVLADMTACYGAPSTRGEPAADSGAYPIRSMWRKGPEKGAYIKHCGLVYEPSHEGLSDYCEVFVSLGQ